MFFAQLVLFSCTRLYANLLQLCIKIALIVFVVVRHMAEHSALRQGPLDPSLLDYQQFHRSHVQWENDVRELVTCNFTLYKVC